MSAGLGAGAVAVGCLLSGCVVNGVGAFIGGAAGFVGTLAAQRLMGRQINITDAIVNGAAGMAIGFLGPLVNPVVLNGVAGMVQYVTTSNTPTPGGMLGMGIVGGMAGLIAGPVVQSGIYAPSALINPTQYVLMTELNNIATAASMTGGLSLARSGASAVFSGLF